MRYVSKRFLSDAAHETGSMISMIETPLIKDMYAWGDGENVKPNLTAELAFRACYGEPVKLEFSAHDIKSFHKRIEKLDLMINELNKMRDQMTEMWYSHLRDCQFKEKEIADKKEKK